MEGESAAIARVAGVLPETTARNKKHKTLRTKTCNLKLQTKLGLPEPGPSIQFISSQGAALCSRSGSAWMPAMPIFPFNLTCPGPILIIAANFSSCLIFQPDPTLNQENRDGEEVCDRVGLPPLNEV